MYDDRIDIVDAIDPVAVVAERFGASKPTLNVFPLIQEGVRIPQLPHSLQGFMIGRTFG